MLLTEYINKLMQHKNLSTHDCEAALLLMSEEPIPEQAAAFLTLLHAKPETSEELQGFINIFKDKQKKITLDQDCIDIVGTGGDGYNTVNISTMTALILASIGVATAKHGNRSSSSQCGSADFIEKLGIPFQDSEDAIRRSLKETHFSFLYAPIFNPLFQKFKTLRKNLGVRTTLNLMGPLLNPVNPAYYLMGVYDPHLLPLFATVLANNNIKKALLVHSQGLDEISLLGKTLIYEVEKGSIQHYELDPKDYGFNYCQLSDIQGGDAQRNSELFLKALTDKESPLKNTLILNSGCALYASQRVPTIEEGILLARDHLHSKKVLDYLNILTAVEIATLRFQLSDSRDS